jgi:hypothetical protein
LVFIFESVLTPPQNRMRESLYLFESVINSRWFLRTSVILFLNKIDVFKRKLPKVCFERCFFWFLSAWLCVYDIFSLGRTRRRGSEAGGGWGGNAEEEKERRMMSLLAGLKVARRAGAGACGQ